MIHLTPRVIVEPLSAGPGLQGPLFGPLIRGRNLGHLVCINLYSVLITPTKVPRESSTATLTIQLLVSSSRSPPPALPLLSIAARNFHQHLDNLNHPTVGRLVRWILPTFGSPQNLVLTTTLTNPKPEMVPDPHGKSTLPSSHLPLLSLGEGHWGAYILCTERPIYYSNCRLTLERSILSAGLTLPFEPCQST